MRYVQLRAFHYVAIHGGFSRAAEALHLTQPAISDQVRKLEQEYDILLFDRRKKQVIVTDAGQKLLEITHRLFEVENQALELLSESRALSSGSLRIMADSALHLLHILRPFRERYPGVQVSVHTGNSEEVVTALLSYEADIGVLGEAPERRDFKQLQLSSTPLVAFAATDSGFSGMTTISLKQLAKVPLVLRERGSMTRQKLEDAALKSGIRLAAAVEAEGREAIREIVASGAGVGIVSEAEFGHDPRLIRIPITGEPIHMDETLICLQERMNGKLIRAFMSMAGSRAGLPETSAPSD